MLFTQLKCCLPFRQISLQVGIKQILPQLSSTTFAVDVKRLGAHPSGARWAFLHVAQFSLRAMESCRNNEALSSLEGNTVVVHFIAFDDQKSPKA